MGANKRALLRQCFFVGPFYGPIYYPEVNSRAAVNCNGADRRRGRMQVGDVGAAVDKRKDQRQPAALVGHRKSRVVGSSPTAQ